MPRSISAWARGGRGDAHRVVAMSFEICTVVGGRLEPDQVGRVGDGLEARQGIRAAAHQQLRLHLRREVAEGEAEEETVELRIGQG